MSQPISLAIEDGIAVITIDSPPVNAISAAIRSGLLSITRSLATNRDARAVVLVCAGRTFMAGADISEFAGVMAPPELRNVLTEFESLPQPIVVALHGTALGGGVEVALAGHYRIADKGAKVGFPEITLGIVPGIGAMVVPFRRWPKAAAQFHAMLLHAERLGAAAAHELGVVDELADDNDALLRQAVARVHALHGRLPNIADAAVGLPRFDAAAARSAEGRTLSAAITGLIAAAVRDAAAAPTLGQALEVGYRAFGAAACTAAAREGITAFIERRPPDFGATG